MDLKFKFIDPPKAPRDDLRIPATEKDVLKEVDLGDPVLFVPLIGEPLIGEPMNDLGGSENMSKTSYVRSCCLSQSKNKTTKWPFFVLLSTLICSGIVIIGMMVRVYESLCINFSDPMLEIITHTTAAMFICLVMNIWLIFYRRYEFFWGSGTASWYPWIKLATLSTVVMYNHLRIMGESDNTSSVVFGCISVVLIMYSPTTMCRGFKTMNNVLFYLAWQGLMFCFVCFASSRKFLNKPDGALKISLGTVAPFVTCFVPLLLFVSEITNVQKKPRVYELVYLVSELLVYLS